MMMIQTIAFGVAFIYTVNVVQAASSFRRLSLANIANIAGSTPVYGGLRLVGGASPRERSPDDGEKAPPANRSGLGPDSRRDSWRRFHNRAGWNRQLDSINSFRFERSRSRSKQCALRRARERRAGYANVEDYQRLDANVAWRLVASWTKAARFSSSESPASANALVSPEKALVIGGPFE